MNGSGFRVGIGYDSHRLVAGRRLILGGIEIPFELGLDGHSDADALTHAITDAVLGAAGLGDIGTHFLPTTSVGVTPTRSSSCARSRRASMAVSPTSTPP